MQITYDPVTGLQLAGTLAGTDIADGSVTSAKIVDGTITTADLGCLDTDVALAANSDTKIASQKAVKTYADTKATKAQEAWTAPTLLNSWVNFNAAAYSQAGYFKDTLGIVHIRGMVKDGSLGGAVFFTLPAGYRPVDHIIFGSIANGAIARIDVQSTGDVTAEAGCSATWTSFDGITFRAA